MGVALVGGAFGAPIYGTARQVGSPSGPVIQGTGRSGPIGIQNDPTTNAAQQITPTSQLSNVTPTQQQPAGQTQQFPNFQPYFQQMHGGMDELTRALQQMESMQSMQMPGQQYSTQPYVVGGQTAGKGVGF